MRKCARTSCVTSLNTNGDAKVDIADPVALLNFLFGRTGAGRSLLRFADTRAVRCERLGSVSGGMGSRLGNGNDNDDHDNDESGASRDINANDIPDECEPEITVRD